MEDVDKDRKVLESRARELAKPLHEEVYEGGENMVVFALGEERYAVESIVVREIRRLCGITPLPGVPPFVLGITNVRGEILSVLDLARILNLPERPYDEGSHMVVLSDGKMTFAVAVHALYGTERLSLEGLQKTPIAGEGLAAKLLLGVRSDRLIVLDGRALLAEKALVVDAPLR